MKRQPFVVVLCSLAVLLAACQAPRKDTGFPENFAEAAAEEEPSPAQTGGPLDGPIEVVDNTYEPVEATVKVGTTVLWEQTGVAPHTVTSPDGKPMDSHPDCQKDLAKCMKAGDEYEFKFEEPGEYFYYCVIHGRPGEITPGNMAGRIIVEA